MTLDRRSRVVFDTLLPGGAHPLLPKGLMAIGFEEFYADFCASASPELQQALRAGLFAAVWIAPLLIRRIPPITTHRPEVRERALEALAQTRWYTLRQAFLAVKTVASLAYGADATVRRALLTPLPPEQS